MAEAITCCSACGKAPTNNNSDGTATVDGAAAVSDGLKMCSVCRTVHYCSIECQKSDWPLHKKTCTHGAVKLLIDAISNNNIDEISRLSNIKRVLNGKVDYTYDHNSSSAEEDEGNNGPVKLKKWTALHACVRSKNTAAMKILLEHGAKTEIKDVHGETPLFVASTSGHPEIVQCLLDHGNANPNAMSSREHGSWTCLMMAAREGDYEITEALLLGGAIVDLGRDMIFRSVMDMSFMLLHGMDSGLRIKPGESALDARERMKKTCKVLFEHGQVQRNNNNQSR